MDRIAQQPLLSAGERYLLALPGFAFLGAKAVKPGLANIEALLDGMGQPQRAYPSVHIAGTNGKGSTAAFIAAIAMCIGKRVGLHTSPHLFRLGERMRVNGNPPSLEWLDDRVARYRALFDRVAPSFFEATVALSFLYFAEEGVDLAVVETGLGGRLDATNILSPKLTILTTIGYDHTAILGDTLEAIAAEKSGIIKPGAPVLSAVERPEARRVVYDAALKRGAAFHDVREEARWEAARGGVSIHTREGAYVNVQPGLAGRHQWANAALAVRAIELLYPDAMPDRGAVETGLSEVKTRTGIRGRLEVCSEEPLIVMDVSHNCESLGAALQFVSEKRVPGSGHLYVAFGLMRDKDVNQMAGQLAEYDAEVWVLPIDSDRAFPPDELFVHLTRRGVNARVCTRAVDVYHEFQQRARSEDALLIAGSHLIVSQFPDLLPP